MKALVHAKEKERQIQEAEAAQLAHVKKMKQLALKESALWKSVDEHLVKATGTSYDKATATLKDLLDLADYKGEMQDFKDKMQVLRERYAGRRALISRLDRAGLI